MYIISMTYEIVCMKQYVIYMKQYIFIYHTNYIVLYLYIFATLNVQQTHVRVLCTINRKIKSDFKVKNSIVNDFI